MLCTASDTNYFYVERKEDQQGFKNFMMKDNLKRVEEKENLPCENSQHLLQESLNVLIFVQLFECLKRFDAALFT